MAHIFKQYGWVAERLKAPVLKTGEGVSFPWVRIPPHPPFVLAHLYFIRIAIDNFLVPIKNGTEGWLYDKDTS